MRIDLWTKEMPVDEMKFFHQTLVRCQILSIALPVTKMAETMDTNILLKLELKSGNNK
jgi:hypothetical protein